VHFVVKLHKKDVHPHEQVCKFIAYNFEKHYKFNWDSKIILLFDMSDAGISNLVTLTFAPIDSLHSNLNFTHTPKGHGNDKICDIRFENLLSRTDRLHVDLSNAVYIQRYCQFL
jgi:hypothetical protein